MPLRFSTHGPHSAQRKRQEGFIRQVFRQAYGAEVQHFYPSLISITKTDGEYAAVAGIRPATEPLFAEHYLERPIERLLSAQGIRVAREEIVEVGNLAPSGVGQARWLIAAMTAYLHAAGFSWVVFTAVPALHNAFHRMGLPLTKLADAARASLDPGHRTDWGRYYEAGPKVYAGFIQTGYLRLNRLIGPTLPRLQALWLGAQEEGRFTLAQQQPEIPCLAILP